MNKKTPKDKTITLCMIVKNETHIIKECLESMLPYIDRYDITDTGSTDGTPELIKEFFDEHGVEGEVYLSDWKGFGDHGGKMGSRTESLRNCDGKADYGWVIDADDYVTGNFEFPENMTHDSYSLRIGREDFTWWRTQIFKMNMEWNYIGVLHEYAECGSKNPPETERLFGEYHVSARTMGARNVGISTKEKYTKDAQDLEKALEDEPENSRYVFYLAQSYFDSQQYEKSLEEYSWPEIQQQFLDAYDFRPIRAEPLYQIARLYRQIQNRPRLSYLYAKQAMEIPYPKDDILFISDDVYKWQLLDELGASAYYAGKPHVGYHACKKLVDENLVPEQERSRVVDNLKQYEQVVTAIHAHAEKEEGQTRIKEKEEKKQAKIDNATREKKGTKCNQNKKRKKRK